MIRKQLLRLNRRFLILALLLLMARLLPAQSSDNQFLTVRSQAHHTDILFRPAAGWTIKPLNNPPALKLLIKITVPEGQTIDPSIIYAKLPPKSGIRTMRLLPLKENSKLLIMEFNGRIGFEWQPGDTPRIVLHDEQFYDPVEALYRQGVALQKTGQLRAALQIYRKIIFQNRRHANAYFKAGQIRYAFGQYRLAEINFKNALKLGCDSLNIYRSIAHLYRRTGRTDLAQKYQRIYREKTRILPGEKKTVIPPQPAKQALTVPPDTASRIETVEAPKDTAVAPATASSDRNAGRPLLLYLLGIGILSGFILYRMVSHVVRKPLPEYYLPETAVPVDGQREKILRAARQALQTQGDPEVAQNARNKESLPPVAPESGIGRADEEAQLHLNSRLATGVELFSQEPEEPDTVRLAQSLNLGVGELELALNLKAHQRAAGKNMPVEEEIRQLQQMNLTAAEIARKMKIGQGEVELFLALTRDRAATR